MCSGRAPRGLLWIWNKVLLSRGEQKRRKRPRKWTQPSERATSLFVYLGGLLFSLLIFVSHASLPSEGPERLLIAFIWPCLLLKPCFWFLTARPPGSIRKERNCRRGRPADSTPRAIGHWPWQVRSKGQKPLPRPRLLSIWNKCSAPPGIVRAGWQPWVGQRQRRETSAHAWRGTHSAGSLPLRKHLSLPAWVQSCQAYWQGPQRPREKTSSLGGMMPWALGKEALARWVFPENPCTGPHIFCISCLPRPQP